MDKHPFILKSLLNFLVLFVFNTLSYAQVYVDIDATGAGDGSSWTDAYTDLQAAIDATSSGEIWVAEGTYKPDVSSPGDRDLSFSMKINVAIYGGFDGMETMLSERDPVANVTILSGDLDGDDVVTGSGATLSITMKGDNSYHVVDNSANNLDNTAVLDGFTISGGNANGSSSEGRGGGMYNSSSSSPTLTNCSFSNNSATAGGGIHNDSSSSPTLTNCSLSNNSATLGGGMYNNSSSNPTLTNCSFSNNSATFGGGMYNSSSSSPTLTNCILWGNGSSFNNTDAIVTYSIIEGTSLYTGTGNSNNDPLFIDASDPDGIDNIPGTADDGIAISSSSPGAGAGNSCPATDITGATRTMCDIGAYIAAAVPNTAPELSGLPDNAVDYTVNTDNGACQHALSLSGSVTDDDMDDISISITPASFTIVYDTPGATSGAFAVTGTITNDVSITITADDGTEMTTYILDIVLADNQSPSITCPDDIEVEILQGASPPSISFDPATATDNCSTTISYAFDNMAISSPYSFPVGTSVVTATASDGDNDDMCTFSVTVTEIPPVYEVGQQSFFTFQAALNFLMGQGGAIVLLRDYTDTEVNNIPGGVTLEIPADLTLTFDNDINNIGTIINRGTIVTGSLNNIGTYKGSGSCQGNFVNNGTIEIGG